MPLFEEYTGKLGQVVDEVVSQTLTVELSAIKVD
jgi:hypothetical protein